MADSTIAAAAGAGRSASRAPSPHSPAITVAAARRSGRSAAQPSVRARRAVHIQSAEHAATNRSGSARTASAWYAPALPAMAAPVTASTAAGRTPKYASYQRSQSVITPANASHGAIRNRSFSDTSAAAAATSSR